MLTINEEPNRLAVEFSGAPRGADYETWREEIWHRFGRIVPEPHSQEQFGCRSEFSSVGGILLTSVQGRTAGYLRRRELLSDQCDDFLLVRANSGSVTVANKDKAIALQPSEMLLAEMCDEGGLHSNQDAAFTIVRIPRRVLLSVCPRAEDRQLAKLADNPVRQAVAGYLTLLGDVGEALDANAQRRLAEHTVDMLAVLLDEPTSGETSRSGGRGAAARLQLIRSYIIENVTDPELSIGTVAAHHGCHPKQVQRLLAAAGLTFAGFVIEERLQLARRQLAGTRGASEKISAIAIDVGFGDLAYFNRKFRARFGMTPSDCRNTN